MIFLYTISYSYLRYEKALQELEILHKIAQDELIKTSNILEGSGALNFKSVFENFESTDYAKNVFSQKYLFADFCSLSLHSDSCSDTNSLEKMSNEVILKSILFEIKNKKQKIEFLQKRFG
jgi:hypothetical protein